MLELHLNFALQWSFIIVIFAKDYWDSLGVLDAKGRRLRTTDVNIDARVAKIVRVFRRRFIGKQPTWRLQTGSYRDSIFYRGRHCGEGVGRRGGKRVGRLMRRQSLLLQIHIFKQQKLVLICREEDDAVFFILYVKPFACTVVLLWFHNKNDFFKIDKLHFIKGRYKFCRITHANNYCLNINFIICLHLKECI